MSLLLSQAQIDALLDFGTAASSAVTGATNATPVSALAVAHGLATGDRALILNVLGNGGANGISKVTKVTTMTVTNFTGSGLDDGTFGGTYTGAVDAVFDVVLDGNGTPDTFKWRKNTEAYVETVPIVAGAMTLKEGVTITFLATTGHTITDAWDVAVGGSNDNVELDNAVGDGAYTSGGTIAKITGGLVGELKPGEMGDLEAALRRVPYLQGTDSDRTVEAALEDIIGS